MMTACVTLLAAAMASALVPASAQPSDIRAIYKRFMQFYKADNYAAALIEAKKYEAAVKVRVGTGNHHYAWALNNLALVHKAQGHYADAEGHYKRALATMEKAKGARHPDVAKVLLGLVSLYALKGQHGEAEGLYRRAMAMVDKAKGARPPDVSINFKASMPPPEYLGTYKGLVIERVLSLADLKRECPVYAIGCAKSAQPDSTMFCVIVLPAIGGNVTPQIQERIRQHEVAHCAGWPAHHPGVRFENSGKPERLPGPQTPKLVWSPTSRSPAATTAAVKQRVVLYEEDLADPAPGLATWRPEMLAPGGKYFIGSAIWRTETLAAGAGQAPEMVVRCDVEIPERQLAMTLSMRRNTNQALRATHTIEVTFRLPADFPFGGVKSVPRVLMKEAGAPRGAPLSGSAVKVTPTLFLLGLSAVETDARRNLELLKERSWFDIPVVYNNGRRAIITVEKGTTGERAFAEAFRAWGPSAALPPPVQQSPPATAPVTTSRQQVPPVQQRYPEWWSPDWLTRRKVASPEPAQTSGPKPPTPTILAETASRPPLPAVPMAEPVPEGSGLAPRVTLYEERLAEPVAARFVGSAIWRTETVAPDAGQASDLAVRCDLEIPERRLAMTMSIRRNTDKALPASHTVEIMFNLPASSLLGGISDVPGILMKEAETTRGAPISGASVKVTSDFFLLGLTTRNIAELLKERSWFDIPVVYGNGRRAIIAVEKGASGERAFAEAFRAWAQ